MDYEVPPEINSGRMYGGLGSSSLVASAAAWQELSAQLGSAGAAFSAVIEALTAGSWLGPSAMTMAISAAPYVAWMVATAAQCEEAAAAASAAATAFEGARAGVVPPPVIEANRDALAAAIGGLPWTAPAVAALEAEYDQMWAQDTGVMYGFAADAAGITGTLVPFEAPIPNSDPIGLAAQAAALGDAGGSAAGQQSTTLSSSALPAGVDGQTMLSMGPELISTIPSTLQGLSSPLTSGLGTSGLGQFQQLLTPFMSVLGNPGMFGAAGGTSAISSAGAPSLAGLGGAASEVEAVAGRAGSLGGLSVPATWTAGASSESAGTAARAVTPVGASGGVSASAAPASAPGGVYGGTPMGAAGMAGRGEGGDGSPRYGKPVKVVHRRG
jgi:PPE-repeat protein